MRRSDIPRISGQITLEGAPLNFFLDRASYSKTTPAPQAGSYTVVLPHNATRLGSDVPQGDGFGSVVVKANGTVTGKGTLGDGTAFTTGARLTRGNHWPLHAVLYRSQGAISGDVAFPPAPTEYEVSGSLSWFSPVNGRAPVYPRGFTTSLSVLGSRFSKTPLVDFAHAMVTIGAGSLEDVPAPFSVDFTSKGQVTAPAGLLFPLKFVPHTSLFKGQFRDPNTGKPVAFSGALLQKPQEGYGMFRGADQQTGFVEFTATP